MVVTIGGKFTLFLGVELAAGPSACCWVFLYTDGEVNHSEIRYISKYL